MKAEFFLTSVILVSLRASPPGSSLRLIALVLLHGDRARFPAQQAESVVASYLAVESNTISQSRSLILAPWLKGFASGRNQYEDDQ